MFSGDKTYSFIKRGITISGLMILVALFCFPRGVQAQESEVDVDPILIRLRARLINVGDSMPIPYANVVYPRHRTGTTTNAEGFFTMEMLNLDSLMVTAVGFKPFTLRVPGNYHESTVLSVFMQPVVYLISEVEVAGEKNQPNLDGIPIGKPTDIPTELRGDAFNEKPPILAAFFNPLSYWQYYLSHKEKQKRLVRQTIALEKNWEMHSKNYNKEVVMMLTGLSEKEADDFMVWFNAQNLLPYTSTEYEVRAAIRTYFEIYRREKRAGN